MTKAELLEALDAGHDEFDALLEDVADADLIAPGASADWSVKDLLAHLTAWEAEMVTALAQLRQGHRAAYFEPYTASRVDELNETYYRENLPRPLERVLADFDGVRTQLIRQVERFSDAELNAPPPKVSGTTPLMEHILIDTLNHAAEHLPGLRAWRERLRAREGGD